MGVFLHPSYWLAGLLWLNTVCKREDEKGELEVEHDVECEEEDASQAAEDANVNKL